MGSCQGVGGGVELPQVTDTPRVAELPRGDKNPRVTTASEIVLREVGRGQEGEEKPPTTRATRAQGDDGGDDERMGGPRTSAPPHSQRDTVAGDGSAGTPTRHTASTDGVRPEHGAIARREYSLLAPTGPVVYPSHAGDHGSAAGHGATWEQAGQDRRETEEGEKTRQRALPARSMQGDRDEVRGSPERLRALNACGRQGKKGGGPPAQQRAPTAHNQGLWGEPQKRQRGPPL